MRHYAIRGALAGIAMLAASAASAVTIDFTSFVGVSFKNSETYMNGGVSVTATPGTTATTTGIQLVEASSPAFTSGNPGSYRGLGVRTDDLTEAFMNAEESIFFSIPAGYVVTSVTVTRTGGELEQQAFSAFVDGSDVSGGGNTIVTVNNSSTDGRSTFAVTEMAGSMFEVRAFSGNDKGVWINSLELELEDPGVVPLPAGIVLLGGALVAGRIATRRKQA